MKDDYDEQKKSDNQKKGRKINKFSYYANGKRISDRSTVYQLLKNPIHFVRDYNYKIKFIRNV